MAHILIAESRRAQRRTLADLFEATGHHVVTTADAVLALATLRVSQHPLIAIIGELSGPLDALEALDLAVEDRVDSACPDNAPQHSYIPITSTPPGALPDKARMLVTQRKAMMLPSTCSVGMLLAAVVETEERMQSNSATCDGATLERETLAGVESRQFVREPVDPHSFFIAAGLAR
jgi:CheY-like chemotaxis protein